MWRCMLLYLLLSVAHAPSVMAQQEPKRNDTTEAGIDSDGNIYVASDAGKPLKMATVAHCIEAKFADARTYFYQGREIDRQVHLGFDLAVTAHIPVIAANRGVVLYAGDLGIYGNCVIVDHGLGVQSLYGHLSSIDVKVGDPVEKGRTMGRSGMTGLAAGDHLHFTMLVNGRAVNPVEWWDPHWIADRVERKLKER